MATTTTIRVTTTTKSPHSSGAEGREHSRIASGHKETTSLAQQAQVTRKAATARRHGPIRESTTVIVDLDHGAIAVESGTTVIREVRLPLFPPWIWRRTQAATGSFRVTDIATAAPTSAFVTSAHRILREDAKATPTRLASRGATARITTTAALVARRLSVSHLWKTWSHRTKARLRRKKLQFNEG